VFEAIWLGHSEPTDWQREDEWNRWYSGTHQPDDLSVAPGLVHYRRLLSLTPQLNAEAPGCKYGVLYDFLVESMIEPLTVIMDIDAETVRTGRHFEAHQGRGGGFLGSRLDGPTAPQRTRTSWLRDFEHDELVRCKESTKWGTAPVYDADRSGYMPPTLERGVYVSLIEAAGASEWSNLLSWLRDGYPVDLSAVSDIESVRCFRSIQRVPTYHCAVFVECVAADSRQLSEQILELEIANAREHGRPSGIRQTGVTYQEIDPGRIVPLDALDYPTDPALYPYLVGGSIERLMSNIDDNLARGRE
jgi:hypothetical protein